jgi:membrane-associated phospholipid phosphatase
MAGFMVFVLARNLADDLGRPVQFIYPIALDRLLGVTPLQHAAWLDPLCVTLYLSYFLIPPTVLVLLWRLWPQRLPRYVVATLTMFAVSAVVHAMVPTAPPWLAAQAGYVPPAMQTVAHWFGENPSYATGIGLSGNAVAAFPSVHLGVTTLIALALWETPIGWVALAYVPAMLWGIVYGAEHYVSDGLAGIALAIACWRGARPWRGRGERSPG